MGACGRFVNGFTFSGEAFYLYLAQDEPEDPEQAQEHEGSDQDDPAARRSSTRPLKKSQYSANRPPFA